MSERMNITLGELAAGLPGVEVESGPQTVVTGVAYDSRKVRPGELFVAVPGTRDDGARFVPAAIEAGASSVLAKAPIEGIGAAMVVAEDVRLAMGRIAARFHGRPDHKMTFAGITGTNGKTTASYILESILLAAGGKPAVMGTINYRFGGKTRPAPTTTPESADILAFAAETLAAGATHLVMEVSSHALDQRRLAGIAMSHAGFTNLSRDHLDYHRDLEDYYLAKRKLFAEVIEGRWTEEGIAGENEPRTAINIGDEHGLRLARELEAAGRRPMTYGLENASAMVRARDVKLSDKGIFATLKTPKGEIEATSRLLGGHNVENILCALAMAIGLGLSLEDIGAGIEALPSVPGRLEPVDNDRGVTVLVDYAHTPDALEHAVSTCSGLKRGRLITVFGCGGDRDSGKRPIMGEVAARGSDLALVTSDNPRTEDPEVIIAQILEGVRKTGAIEIGEDKDWGELRSTAGAYLVQPDRARAIALAVERARPGDMVLVAGKGHEDYQILGTEKIHFDDREQAAMALERKREK